MCVSLEKVLLHVVNTQEEIRRYMANCTFVCIDYFDFSADCIVEADIAYLDFNWTREMDEAGVFFVIRGKENIKLLLEEWPLDRENPANKGIQCDWQVESELYSYRQKYTKKLGMVQVCDDDSGNYFE